ncbi:uncharacterized protein V6R79_017425 [Siganus canaliculatus]
MRVNPDVWCVKFISCSADRSHPATDAFFCAVVTFFYLQEERVSIIKHPEQQQQRSAPVTQRLSQILEKLEKRWRSAGEALEKRRMQRNATLRQLRLFFTVFDQTSSEA